MQGWTWFHLLFHLILMFLTSSAEASIAKPGCPDKCGNVSIPYPFGIKDGCFRDEQFGFNISCNGTYQPPKPFLGDYEFLEISFKGEAIVTTYIASDCYEESGYNPVLNFWTSMAFDGSPFTFSNTRNKFTAIGCDTQAYITGSSGRNFTSGCLSFCWDEESVQDKSCSGIGCCQTSIPDGVKHFFITVNSSSNHMNVLKFNPCSYAFLIQEDKFHFNLSDMATTGRYRRGEKVEVPVVADWAIGNHTCELAQKNLTSYACKSLNSTCYNSTNGPGYRCNCSQGFQGNPYLEEGCKDIDECNENTHNCKAGICHNTEGSFTCSCPKGRRGDGINKCTPKSELKIVKIISSICLIVVFVLIASPWAYWAFKERKLIKLREKFFEQNGGNVIKNQSNGEAVTIFTSEELERATKKCGQSLIIDQGGYGMVFKGELPNYGEVTIKKYNIEDNSQIVQFINEVTFLCQINHTNVVKLLGCCFETPVPFLVYEFISNGASLFHHIHEATLSFLSLERRLRIASETAGALAYLHSQRMPIFHRDVKSTNILLDSNLTAKVADFGASGLVPLNNNQVNDMVKETLGYLDPEYFYTGQLTEKSDVYSLGVVLVELLTGKMPICSSGSNRESITLPVLFTDAMRENHLSRVLEKNIADEGGDNQLMEVAQLAVRCLSVKGEERPTMTEVESELNRLRTVQPPGGQRNYEERHDLPTNQLS